MPTTQRKTNVDMGGLEHLVQEILQDFEEPYPEDITDQVFLEIQRNQDYMNRYSLYAENHKDTANQIIGKLVSKHTGLHRLGTNKNPKSCLIKSYAILGR
jgi:hypothetical protein